MKKYIISISIALLLSVAFFLMLILTDTPMNLSFIGSGVATLIVNLSVCGVLLETNDATIDTLPLTFYGIAFIVAVLVGIYTRKLFISLDTERAN